MNIYLRTSGDSCYFIPIMSRPTWGDKKPKIKEEKKEEFIKEEEFKV